MKRRRSIHCTLSSVISAQVKKESLRKGNDQRHRLRQRIIVAARIAKNIFHRVDKREKQVVAGHHLPRLSVVPEQRTFRYDNEQKQQPENRKQGGGCDDGKGVVEFVNHRSSGLKSSTWLPVKTTP
jgi:hypothetical protein